MKPHIYEACACDGMMLQIILWVPPREFLGGTIYKDDN